MYLCGHPGTGKTSALNQVLSTVHKESEGEFELFMYNAMTYNDVKNFGITLYKDLCDRFSNTKTQRLNRADYDMEDIGFIIAKALHNAKDCHKIIVIDEVDQFSSHEKSFTYLIKAILRGNKKSNMTNTSVMGIANSVDLPFKKKHSAIAMRDCQMLFSPYSLEELQAILEEKMNWRWTRFR